MKKLLSLLLALALLLSLTGCITAPDAPSAESSLSTTVAAESVETEPSYTLDPDGSYSGRGSKRIVFSSDGLVYYTGDHYRTFTLLYGEP